MLIDFAYAQARVQARLGQRLPEDGWRLLESSLGLAQYLALVRGTVLARHVQHFSQAASAHAIERSFRTDWREDVAAVAGWVPARWRAAVEWTRWIPDLDAVAYLLRGESVLGWMREDPVLAAIALEDPGARRLAINESPFVMLHDAGIAVTARQLWLTRWHALLPKRSPAERPGLRRFVRILTDFHAQTLRQDIAVQDLNAARADVGVRLARMIRHYNRQPVIVFCHLLLAAFDLARLRDGLLRRALFGDPVQEAAR